MPDVERPARLDEFEMAERRYRVGQLYLRRQTMRQIARQLSVGTETVHRDLVALKEEWRRENLGIMAEALERELWELDEMERDAILQYTRALQPVVETPSAGRTTQTIHVGEALPWFMARLKVKERRSRLLGLDKAEKPDGLTIPSWVLDAMRMNDDDLLRELAVLAREAAEGGLSLPALPGAAEPPLEGERAAEGVEPE